MSDKVFESEEYILLIWPIKLGQLYKYVTVSFTDTKNDYKDLIQSKWYRDTSLPMVFVSLFQIKILSGRFGFLVDLLINQNINTVIK